MPQLSMHTPVGDITISEERDAIVSLDWGWGSRQAPTGLLRSIRTMLERYFDGAPFDGDLPLSPAFGTQYQRRVWAALRTIPHGQTRTYGDIARMVGGSARSVGSANGKNPIPILIPCHRVVACNGIGGYSGDGGTTTKRSLLAIEAAGAAVIPDRNAHRGIVGWDRQWSLL